jgi:TPR repeat protein
LYRNGEGLSQDYAEALQWFRKAAEHGHAQAQYNLGNMYLKGQGVTQDREEARKWFTRAAEDGHKGSRKALDSM